MGEYWTDPVLRKMWERKGQWREPEVFAHAELIVAVAIREHQSNDSYRTRTYPAGTRVLCTMVSRFGDVGIRARNIDEIRHGYDARVEPGLLRNVTEASAHEW